MRWCCAGLLGPTTTSTSTSEAGLALTAGAVSSINGSTSSSTICGGGSGRRQQLTIHGDQVVVLDATVQESPPPGNSHYQAKKQHVKLPPTNEASEKLLPTSSPPPTTTKRLNASLEKNSGLLLSNSSKGALYVTPNPSLVGHDHDHDHNHEGATTGSSRSGSLCPLLDELEKSRWRLTCASPSSARSVLESNHPQLVILDYKLHDIVSIARTLHALPESENVLFAVLSDRVLSDKRKLAIADGDFQLFLVSSSTDVKIFEFVARLSARCQVLPALFAVVESAEQPIKICDNHNVVQYVNRAYESQTGLQRQDVLGTVEPSTSSASAVAQALLHHQRHSHPLPPSTPNNHGASCSTDQQQQPQQHGQQHRQSASSSGTIDEPVATGAAAMDHNNHHHSPAGLAGPPTTYPINRRRSSDWHCISVPSSSSPQFVYVKRGSADANMCRDMSLKSLKSQSSLVAPITEALSILANVLQKCDDDTQPLIQNAIKILSSTELYAPTIARFQNTDRIASGYYDGLIRLHHPSRQRKRSVVDAFREQRRSSGTDVRRRVSSDVVNALENESDWQFDVIELERVTDHHALSHLGVKIFQRWNVIDTLQCSADVLARWLTVIEANYSASNTYHNATHAADVLQATSYYLDSESVAQNVQDTHAIASLIAATVHDLDHPGRGNAFLMNTRQQLALLYNDQSVLENHHVALAFQLTLSQPGINIFSHMPREEFTAMRQAIIDFVLATDMSRHFEYLTKFQQIVPNLPDDDNREANSMTICRMMVKCADIANPTREFKLCHQWAMRIVEEYFDQTAEEREKGLPLTMKGFERSTCNVPMTQCTFVDLFARETFELWCGFADLPELLQFLENNYVRWKEMSATWNASENANILSKTI